MDLDSIITRANSYAYKNRCGDTQEFVFPALANKWDSNTLKNPKPEDFYVKDLIYLQYTNFEGDKYNSYPDLFDVIAKVSQVMDTHELCALDIDVDCLEHSMILLKDKEVKVLDSYVRHRSLGFRPWKPEVFQRLLKSPNIDDWNKLCGSQESKGEIDDGEVIVVKVSYLAPALDNDTERDTRKLYGKKVHS